MLSYFVSLGSESRVEMSVSRVEMSVSRVEMLVSRVEVSVSRVEMSVSRVEMFVTISVQPSIEKCIICTDYLNKLGLLSILKYMKYIILIKLLLTLNEPFNILEEVIMFEIGHTTAVHFS